MLTRLDVLDGISPVRVCVAYELDGKRVDEFPSSPGDLERCRPILEDRPGWSAPTAGVTDYDSLPAEAKAYVAWLEELIGASIDLISTGPQREESIVVRPIIV